MRKWRVGSISMGLSLIALGVTLFLSQLYNWEVTTFILSWIPILLIILGIEILIYLLLSKQEQPIVRYDVFSILFILFIGVLTLGIYFVTSTGLVTTVKEYVDTEEVNGMLPEVNQKLSKDIKKVVIDANNNGIELEANETDEVNIFGSFRSNYETKLSQDDYISINKVGDTLYIEILSPPSKNRMNHHFVNYDATISIPGNRKVEARTYLHEVNLDLAKLKADWYIANADIALLSDGEDANVKVTTDQPYDETKSTEGEDLKKKTYGDGTHSLYFQHVNSIKAVP
ncbi:LiaF transmembrane domain-containing protein [Gracilibacillus dipsosauri]|uniref:Exosporium protein E n=1 Tax=Gracilibacillus dipsosauri TaxID=178340 RepID=A0A317L3S1_9BACI|nr:hypothetical protein [Gracilibacillus dipsosauri]PWU68449.1 hypothetical protein DLJ74_08365 [Gracilibacillus dipsosauri]